MKKLLALLLAVSVLCSCNNGKPTDTGGTSYIENPFETTVPATESTEATTEEKSVQQLARERMEQYGRTGWSYGNSSINGIDSEIREFDYTGGSINYQADFSLVRAPKRKRIITRSV